MNPEPKKENDSGNGEIGEPSVIKYATPRHMESNPKVVIKLGTAYLFLKNATTNPLIAPTTRVIGNANHIFTPMITTKYPKIALLAATKEPTDKSISPVIIMNVIPMEIIAIIDICLKISIIFVVVAKLGAKITK